VAVTLVIWALPLTYVIAYAPIAAESTLRRSNVLEMSGAHAPSSGWRSRRPLDFFVRHRGFRY
jgi:hypothetical protein